MHYSIRYQNVRDLINCLVDYADSPDHNLDLMDVFILVHRLAFMHSQQLKAAEQGEPVPGVLAAPDVPMDIHDLQL